MNRSAFSNLALSIVFGGSEGFGQHDQCSPQHDVSRGFISIMSFECQKSFLSLLPLGGVPLSPIIGRLPGACHAIEN
jgi:hypothetical protein